MNYITNTITLLILSLLLFCGSKKSDSDLKQTNDHSAIKPDYSTATVEPVNESKSSVNESEPQDSLYNGSIIDSAYRKYISYWRTRDSAESNVLKKTDGAVFRPEPTILAIKTETGDTVYCIDWCVASADEPMDGELYQLEDYLPAFNLCIIQRSEPAPARYIQFVFVKTGKRFDGVPGLPNVSPDGRCFITCVTSFQEESLGPVDFPDGFIIWEKRGKNIVKVFEKKWGWTIAKWIDDSRIALERPLNVNIYNKEPQVFILDTLVYSLDNWFHETDGKCITSENKTPFAVEDLGDNYEEGVKYNGPGDVNFKFTVLKKTSPEKSEYPNAGDEKSFRITKYTRQLKNRFMYVRLVAIEGLGQINDQRAANALLDFICNPENSKEDRLSVDFAKMALKSSKTPVEEMILDRLQSHIEAANSFETYLSDSVSWEMLYFWKEIATVRSLTFLRNTAYKWPNSYQDFIDKALSQIEKELERPEVPAPVSSEEATQLNRKIGLEDVFNRIVDLSFDNAGMNIHYRPVDKKLLDTLILETDQNVHAAVTKILESAEKENLWASRFLILRSCLNSKSKRLRIWALEKLSEEETWHSRILIKSVLDDKDADIRNAAVEALKGNYPVDE